MTDATTDRLRATLRSLIEEHQTDAASLSRQIGRSKDYIRDFLEGRKTSIPLQSLVKIEQAFALGPGFLLAEEYPGNPADALARIANRIAVSEGTENSEPNWPRYQLKSDRLAVFSFRDATDGTLFVNRHVHFTIPKPDIMENAPDAFGLLIEGDVMSPAFDPGDVALVNPNISFRTNADALFFGEIGSADLPESEFQRSALRRLTGYDDTHWHVRQLCPARETTLPRAQWPRVSRVVGKYSRS